MANIRMPEPPDNAEYWGYTPLRETLYGSDTVPRRFLRIIDGMPGGAGRMFHSYEDDPGDPSSRVTVETVTIDEFIKFASFGYTPYLECSLSGHKLALDLSKVRENFISEAVLRNYDARVRDLMAIADEKRYSFASSSDSQKALMAEIAGALSMWEMLMNTGNMRALNCLSYFPGGVIPKMSWCKDKQAELQGRMMMGSFSPMPYKVSQAQRDHMINVFMSN